MKNHSHWLAPAVALCLPLATLAQSGRADPAGVAASGPALRYQSAFAGYKPWQDLRPADWRAVNDKVRDAAAAGGGHSGHGTSTPMAPSASAPAPKASAPAMRSHEGHRMHGGKP